MKRAADNWAELLPDEDYAFFFGLKPGDAADFFAPTPEHEALVAQRRRWLETDAHRYAALLPEGGPMLRETIELARRWNSLSSAEDASVRAASGDPWAELLALGAAWEMDFVLLSAGGAEPRMVGGVVCFPSSWRLADKVGHPISFIHGPVPGLNGALAPRIAGFLSRLKPGPAFLRANWGLSRSAELNQHPEQHIPRLTPPLRVDEVFVRIENQALVALPASAGVLFGIRLEVHPLDEVRRDPVAARGLARALRTMPDDMAAYKNITAARADVLAMLDGKS
jgi:hypothetical protein